MNLDEEVRLYTTNTERERTENLATLYSIIVSLEYLERAYVRDSVTGKEWVICFTSIARVLVESRVREPHARALGIGITVEVGSTAEAERERRKSGSGSGIVDGECIVGMSRS